MPIFNKDGTIFRLQGPNPLMENQSRWEDGKVILHNFEFQEIISLASPPEISKSVPEETKSIQIMPQNSIPEPIVVPVPISKPEPPKESKTKFVNVNCLPGKFIEHIDRLYDEVQKTVVYGNKFIFQATIESRHDLVLILGTADKNVTIGSILFPQTGHMRWWKVQDIEAHEKGNRLICVPSDEQPNFSDQ